MGHLVGKDIYRNLGRKIDSLNVRVPWNETFYAILKELYTEEEAELVASLPTALSTADELQRYLQINPTRLRKLLEVLCRKGLVVDIFVNHAYYYIPSPLVVGIYEFTMMRTDEYIDSAKMAQLFHTYFNDEDFFKLNFGAAKGKQMGLMRTLPYEESFTAQNQEGPAGPDFVEVLDYEKATAIIEQADIFSIGICSCRHEQQHTGEKACDMPLDTCMSLSYSAEYLIRNNLAKKASKSQMLENIARSKELGLVLNADNVKNNCQFICHCCTCCCHVLQGVNKYGFPDIIVTSSFLAEVRQASCQDCGACVASCSVNAIKIVTSDTTDRGAKPKKKITIDTSICIGCGVCVNRCKSKALVMVKRPQRVLHPETTFEKAIIKCLEKGTLQEQLFPNPKSITQKVLRGLVGGFLRLSPVKQTLMSDTLRSSFLSMLKIGARLQGKEWLTHI